VIEEDAPLEPGEVRAAAAAGRLASLLRSLVLAERWLSTDLALRIAGDASIPLEEATGAARAVEEAIADLEPADRRAAGELLREARRELGRALERRCGRAASTERDRQALAAAAELLAAVGDTRRAAALFETVGRDARAAELYGALGDLERMEACLDRVESRRADRLRVTEAVRRFEQLCEAGARAAAVIETERLAGDAPDLKALKRRARELEARLCRGRSVLVRRRADGGPLRIAAAPARLGRDGRAEIPLRDPGVSRLHAEIVVDRGTLLLADLGSRAGTWLGDLALAGRVPLRGTSEVRFGAHSTLRFEERGPALVHLLGVGGLDRGLEALVGDAEVALDPAALGLPAAVTARFGGPAVRLEWGAGVPARLNGRLVGGGCDIARGDVLAFGAGVELEIL
jgi:hypothetical protein